MADIEDWSATAAIDPEWTQAVKDYMGGQEPDLGAFPTIDSMREWITNSKLAMSAQMGPTFEGIRETDHQVPMRDGHHITCRTYTPETAPSGGSPLVVIYHGGGFCIGGLENEELLCRLLTSELGATCVNVDYRLAPEHKFPSCAHDSVDATKWAATNAASLGADPARGFVIGGTSAGGNLTAVVLHTFLDDRVSPPITGCHYMIPTFCQHEALPAEYHADNLAWDQNQSAPILSRRACDLFLNNYISRQEDKHDPRLSPLLWPSGHAGHPPATFQVCGADPLRDEALIFERLLRRDLGVSTRVQMYPGQPHGFWSVLPQMQASKKFVRDSVDSVRWLLGQG